MTYKCQDKDCRKLITDSPPPLTLNMPARSYKAGDLRGYIKHDTTTPAYTVLKCPYCRGNLIPINDL